MNLLRSHWVPMGVAVLLGCLFVCPASAHAQTFVELGGGWNYFGSTTTGASNFDGSNFRASIGWQVAPKFRWRIDASTYQFDRNRGGVTPIYPCPPFGCGGDQSERVNGLSVNGMVSLDSRGILYVNGGAGLYSVTLETTDWRAGLSAGVGIAVPVASQLRVVLEARYTGLLGTTFGPRGLVPITIGFRY